jgi:similar to stage IV sporulation protein
MSKIYEKLRGSLRIELSGAYVEDLLNAAALSAIELWRIDCVDSCTVTLSMYEPDYPELQALVEKCGCQVKIISAKGGSKDKKLLRRRAWLLAFTAVVAALLYASSLFVWEIDVVGNEQLSRGQVLRALSNCGVDIGSYRPSISPDLVRSAMLQQLPELAWMTVNVSGSRAVVVVVEREPKPEIYSESEPADIVASQTGIINRVSVENGKTVKYKGQSVLEGEILVSGVMDSLSNGSKYVRAKAQVMADTWYEITAICPAQEEIKTPKAIGYNRFAIIFGKTRINLYFNSGKAIDECDKIIHKYRLGVDGLFALPVTLVREELRGYDTQLQAAYDTEQMEQQLSKILSDRINGEILSQSFTAAQTDELYTVTMRSRCLEDIAKVVSW